MKTFWRIVYYLRDYRLRLIGAFFCSAGVAGLSAVYAWLVQPVLDGIFIDRNRDLLLILPLGVFGVALLKALFAYGQGYLMSYVGHWVVADVRQQLFVHIVRLPIRFHDANTSGRLMARVISDVNEMANAIPSVLKDIFQQGLTFAAMLAVVFYQNWKLATIVLFVLPLSSLVLVRVGRRIRKLSKRGQESIGKMASVLKEAFSGIKIVKAYGQEEKEAQRFSLTNQSFRTAKIKSSQTSAMSSPLLEVIGVCGVAFIIWYGGGLVIAGEMKPGEFFSFLAAMFMAYAPVRIASRLTDMRFGVVVFPGSNCDEDAFHAAKTVFGQDADYLWHKDTDLKGADVLILPGGFAHGDYLRTGAMARFSPIMGGCRRSPRVADRCSASATGFRFCSRRVCCPARCCAIAG